MPNTNPWDIANPQQKAVSPGLYLVPTPIGNLRDMTFRALDVLAACDAVLCEDTRVTGRLFKAYGLACKKIVYNDHTGQRERESIIERLRGGARFALVSDAGTPLVSDPGYKLVRDCLEAGVAVVPLPGANAVLPALQLSGMASDIFTFGGFLPSKQGALDMVLTRALARPETHVFYESAARLSKTLSRIALHAPDRNVAVVREITKLYEESVRGTAADLAERYTNAAVKGEIVLVIDGAPEAAISPATMDEAISDALDKGESVKDIASRLSRETGMKKGDVYAAALKIAQDRTP